MQSELKLYFKPVNYHTNPISIKAREKSLQISLLRTLLRQHGKESQEKGEEGRLHSISLGLQLLTQV